MSAAEAGAGSPQDDGRSVDRSAAVQHALLTVRADQAALTQAVRLRDVAGIPGGVVGDPGKRKSLLLNQSEYKQDKTKTPTKSRPLCDAPALTCRPRATC